MLRYTGRVIHRDQQHIVLEANFDRDDIILKYIHFRRGDRFTEHFYTNRWYNIFTIYDVDDDHFKGWYCNITRPAILTDNTIHADDLALDLFVYPDRRMLVLDQNEFDTLPLSTEERRSAQTALQELQHRVRQAQPPFDAFVTPPSQ